MTALASVGNSMTVESEGNIGAEMARLRAGFGMSQQDVSNRLHIRVRYIQAIEENRFELLPGKVYARGYVHTYAEFLGLDPAATVEKCLAGVFDQVPQSKFTLPPTTSRRRSPRSNSWKFVVAFAVVIGLIVTASKSRAPHATEEVAQTVEQPSSSSAVPESMLRHMRSMPMPTARNYDCLTGNGALACFYTDPLAQVWLHPELFAGMALVGELDLTTAVEEKPVQAAPPVAPSSEIAPAEHTGDVHPQDTQAKALGVLEPAAGAPEVVPEKPVAEIPVLSKKQEKPASHAAKPTPVHVKPIKPNPNSKASVKTAPSAKPFPPLKTTEKPARSVFDEVDHNITESQHD